MRSESFPPGRPRRLLVVAAALLAPLAAGCGGSPTAPQQDQIFYLHGGGVLSDKNISWETYFKPLDQPAGDRVPRVVGVGVLGGDVRLGRPIDWNVRAADMTPHHRFISYQSPRQFIFSIYERIDPPEDPWPTVERRYEADVTAQGSQILAGRMPVATANTQGRAYLLKTKVPAKPEYMNNSREVLIRGERRLMLVQIIHTSDDVASIEDELAAVFKSITVY